MDRTRRETAAAADHGIEGTSLRIKISNRRRNISLRRSFMKAIAVIPGKPNSIHLREVPKPSVDEIPNGRGVLVNVLRVGVDGTDKEINAAEYGMAPPGFEYLILGHESFGIVEEVGANVTELNKGDYV